MLASTYTTNFGTQLFAFCNCICTNENKTKELICSNELIRKNSKLLLSFLQWYEATWLQ